MVWVNITHSIEETIEHSYVAYLPRSQREKIREDNAASNYYYVRSKQNKSISLFN